jgi:hypothetical protein
MTLAVLALLTSQAAPKLPTIPELMKNIHEAYRKNIGFKEEWIIDSGEGVTRVTRLVDGNRFSLTWKDGDKTVFEEMHDGKRHFLAMHPAKMYVLKEEENTGPKEAFKLEKPEDVGDGNFKFGLASGYTFYTWFETWPVVKSLTKVTVNDEPMRLVTATFTKKDKPVNVKYWFDATTWLPRGFEIEGPDSEGKERKLVVKNKLAKGIKFTAADFAFDMKKVEDYTKIDGS